jgi:hypothetical protein
MAEESSGIEFSFEWTCSKCGCHVYEEDGFGWLDHRKMCTNCRVVAP